MTPLVGACIAVTLKIFVVSAVVYPSLCACTLIECILELKYCGCRGTITSVEKLVSSLLINLLSKYISTLTFLDVVYPVAFT